MGQEAAIELVRAFGGVALHIPKRAGSASYESIVEVVGHDAMVKLVDRIGGTRIKVPRCHRLLTIERWRNIVADRNGGASKVQLALRYGITLRSIDKILSKMRERRLIYRQSESLN